MAGRIRVLATHVPGQALVQRLTYSAEFIDDADPHATSLWSCGHQHSDPSTAYHCAVAWLESLQRAGIQPSERTAQQAR